MKDRDPRKVGRRFSNATMELALGGYAGFHTTTPPSAESAYGVYWPALVPAAEVEHVAVLPDGTRVAIPATTGQRRRARWGNQAPVGPWLQSPRRNRRAAARCRTTPVRCALRWAGCARPARATRAATPTSASGPATRPATAWLRDYLTTERLRSLLPEAKGLEVRRFELPNLLALNFVIAGLLGRGGGILDPPRPAGEGARGVPALAAGDAARRTARGGPLAGGPREGGSR